VPTCFFELGVVKRSRLVQRPAVSEVARVEAMLGDQSFESQRFTGISGSAERSDAILSGNVRGRDVSTARGQERKMFLNRPHPPLAPIMQIAPRIVGVGFFDYNHGQTGVAPNAIELHSVLGFACLSG